MRHVEKIIRVEGVSVSVTASINGDRIDVGFALTERRDAWLAGLVEDPFSELVGWENPMLALRVIGKAALSVAREMFAENANATVATFSGCCTRRCRVYERLLERAGIRTSRYTFDDGDYV